MQIYPEPFGSAQGRLREGSGSQIRVSLNADQIPRSARDKLRIDFVAPPFAGHLFPVLDLATQLRRRGLTSIRVISTSDTAETIRACGLTAVELLPGREREVWAIANTTARAGLHPLRLYQQFRANMALMADVAAQLRTLWSTERPDVVIADFTVPVAGAVAMELGISWWTSMVSICAIETRTGTPSYLGGWMPRADAFGRMRDVIGRKVIHLFKLGVAATFRKRLAALHFPAVYRHDGTEAAYSPQCILGIGMREFELDRDDWPPALRFIGPLTGTPPFAYTPPDFPDGKPAILVTLGTHLPWAREQAAALMEEVAAQMPDCVFHFAMGKPGSTFQESRGNLHFHGFFPYDDYLPRYAASINHAGTGIVYSCIKAGVPQLVWPHDYDQYDHAARVVARGIGLRLKPARDAIVRDLRRLLTDESIRARVREFQERAARYDAAGWVAEALGRE
jgi:UDP:flavonoid glycosyltransferase YjiC (YdhE family)